VPQFAPCFNLFELVARCLVSEWCQRLCQIPFVVPAQRPQHCIIAEFTDTASNENTAFVQRITQGCTGITENNNRAFLHHEAGHIPDVPTDDDRTALHGNTGPRRDVATHHDCPTTDGCRSTVTGIFLDHDRPTHHPLGQPPAGRALDCNRRAIAHAAAVVADATLEQDTYRHSQSDSEVVVGSRVTHADVCLARSDERLDSHIDLARGFGLALNDTHAGSFQGATASVASRTGEGACLSRSWHTLHVCTVPAGGSHVSTSAPQAARRATSSVAIAMY